MSSSRLPEVNNDMEIVIIAAKANKYQERKEILLRVIENRRENITLVYLYMLKTYNEEFHVFFSLGLYLRHLWLHIEGKTFF